jgi:hypothetical protein
MGEKRTVYRILVGTPEGKRPLGRPRSRWVDNIKMDLRVIGWDGAAKAQNLAVEPQRGGGKYIYTYKFLLLPLSSIGHP